MTAKAPTPPGEPAARAGLGRHAGAVATVAARLMERDHAWYRALSAQDRSWVGLVAQAGINAFLSWYREGDPDAPVASSDIFGTAPAELAHTITLRQALDLVRTTITAVESELGELAATEEQEALQAAVMRYSREVAFAAAEVYAAAAESRGAWDARLESLVVHAVIRGEADDSFHSRAAELGWAEVTDVVVLAGAVPADAGSARATTGGLRRAARHLDLPALCAVQADRLVTIIGHVEDPDAVATAFATHFGPGPLVVGPRVPHLFAAGRSARVALSGLDVASAWPQAPRPVAADELLAERALNGEAPARRLLIDRVYRRLHTQSPDLLDTITTFLETGRSVEASARVLFVHPNTVRYRLRRTAEIVGLDAGHPREAWTLQVALTLGRITDAPTRGWRTAMARRR